MKLEPLFYVKENKLYRISDNTLIEPSSLKKIEIKWTTIEIEDESYNEEYLAQLRDELKTYDESNKFVILVPIIDKKLETPEQFELFNNAYNHTARRIKDCISVVGFELPSELTSKGFDENTPAQEFINLLSIKHAQYLYFTMLKSAPSNVIIY